MFLREDDGSLSRLARTFPMGRSEFFCCVREDGTVIIAAPEDLVEDDDAS
jgi:hypothetical protein